MHGGGSPRRQDQKFLKDKTIALSANTKPDIRRRFTTSGRCRASAAESFQSCYASAAGVVDDGGHLPWLQRLDGRAPVSAAIAPAKARTAAVGRRESRVYEEMINGRGFSFISAPTLEGMLEGGVSIVLDGHCVGAVGGSGVKSTQDVQVARTGIAALATG